MADHKLIKSHHLREQIHGSGRVGHFNAKVANFVSNLLSNMWFFWFCVVLDLVELPAVISSPSPVVVVAYISQTVIQLLALPALGAGQKLQAATADARAETDHRTLVLLDKINRQQLEILQKMQIGDK